MRLLSEVKGYLESVRELISCPEHWTQGAMARDNDGRDVDHVSRDAVCWCLGGAINKVYDDLHRDRELYVYMTGRHDAINVKLTRMKVNQKLSQLSSYGLGAAYPWASVTHFNDTHSHGEVLELLDQAISDS